MTDLASKQRPDRARRRLIANGAVTAGLMAAVFATFIPAATQPVDKVWLANRALLFGTPTEFGDALQLLQERGRTDVAPALTLALRFRPDQRAQLIGTLRAVTGHDAADWFDWMLWQEQQVDLVPHMSFRELKLAALATIDPNFLQFFQAPWTERARMGIRLEEITWGGVAALRGIPSLDNPRMIAAAEADYLRDDDLVFGVEIVGDARAYPLRIMGWHEMLNDVIGGVPVALAYCTLCGSGILYETKVAGREAPFVFGSSGLLYRSNKLMFDWETMSIWNQFTGRPVVGPLSAKNIELAVRPVVITDWKRWRSRHPATTVLSLDTGHERDYGSGVVYKDYFTSPGLWFPVNVRPGQLLRQKAYVFGIHRVGAAKAWPLAAFEGGAVINDAVGDLPVVLIGDAATRTVRAYERGKREFAWREDDARVTGPGGIWFAAGDALVGPDGGRLPRVAGRLAYWFAWDNFHGVRSALYGSARE